MANGGDFTQRTWVVSTVVAEKVNDLAGQMETFPSTLVDLLLTRGLAAIESGEWPLQRVPVKYEVKWRG